MKNTKLKAFCKINLSLRVLKKLNNNYHKVQSFISFVDLYDEIYVSEIKKLKDRVIFFGRFKKGINAKSNTVSKVLKLFRKNNMLKNKKFRIYYSNDVIGCQIGGALKNIYAIAAGISDGLNLGENARSALITRSFVEISRFAMFFKSKKETIFGLSGLGDLMLTCNSSKSRNTNFGIKIANIKHKNFEKELDKNAITEGYYTAKAAKKIASENNIEMPILQSVFNILYNGFDIEDEINKLMSRPLTIENI